MADFKYQRDTNRFYCLGLDLNRPVDAVKELHFPLLRNVRTYQTGRLEPRQGLTLIGSVDSGPVHSIRRLNAPRTSDWTRIIGADRGLNSGQTSFAKRDSGYSGNPLAMIPYRPAQSPDPWMYCMDSARQRKVDVGGNVHQVGLPPPVTAPTVTRAQPLFKTAFAVPYSITNWHWGSQNSSGVWDWATSFVETGGTVGNRVNTTITKILYDSGTTGWCCIRPADPAHTGSGMTLVLDRTGVPCTVLANDVYAGVPAATTITGITFKSGTSGDCSLVLASTDGAAPNVLLYNSTRASYARITSVTEGPDKQKSIECSPAAGSGWAAGDACLIVPTIRCYTTVAVQNGDAIENDYFGVQTNATGDLTEGLTGTIVSPKFSPALDWSGLASGVTVTPDDYIHLSFAMNAPAEVQSCRLFICCANTTYDHAFETDYFFKDFTPEALASALEENFIKGFFAEPNLGPFKAGFANIQNNLQILLQQGHIDQAMYTQALYGSLRPGYGQFNWGEMNIKIAELVPVGNPNLQTIYFIGWSTTVIPPSQLVPTPASATYLSSVSLRGGYGVDVGVGTDYTYRYRARCSSTGVTSNWSPPTREPFHLVREQANLVAPAQYTLASEADYLDYQRHGGPTTNWHYLGSVLNSASPVAFADKYPDDVVLANLSEEQIHYQLWPVLGAPASGTLTSVCGTIVTGSGFSTTWAPLTQIEINGVFYTIYRVNSSTQLELYQNAGSQGAVAWRVAEPILQAQTIPCFWGPLAETLFGCGDSVNPQRLYWTNVGSADDTLLDNWKDITNPSEPLQNGVMYNGRSYLWSTERMFQILPAAADEAGNVVDWNVQEIPNANGLAARWAFTGHQCPTGPQMAFLGKDGIYATDGGVPASMTEENLRPLFPNEGNPGVPTNGVPAPLYQTAGQSTAARLTYYDGFTYFEYSPDPAAQYPAAAPPQDILDTPAVLLTGMKQAPDVSATSPATVFWPHLNDTYGRVRSVMYDVAGRVFVADAWELSSGYGSSPNWSINGDPVNAEIANYANYLRLRGCLVYLDTPGYYAFYTLVQTFDYRNNVRKLILISYTYGVEVVQVVGDMAAVGYSWPCLNLYADSSGILVIPLDQLEPVTIVSYPYTAYTYTDPAQNKAYLSLDGGVSWDLAVLASRAMGGTYPGHMMNTRVDSLELFADVYAATICINGVAATGQRPPSFNDWVDALIVSTMSPFLGTWSQVSEFDLRHTFPNAPDGPTVSTTNNGDLGFIIDKVTGTFWFLDRLNVLSGSPYRLLKSVDNGANITSVWLLSNNTGRFLGTADSFGGIGETNPAQPIHLDERAIAFNVYNNVICIATLATLTTPNRSIWRSADAGVTWARVHSWQGGSGSVAYPDSGAPDLGGIMKVNNGTWLYTHRAMMKNQAASVPYGNNPQAGFISTDNGLTWAEILCPVSFFSAGGTMHQYQAL